MKDIPDYQRAAIMANITNQRNLIKWYRDQIEIEMRKIQEQLDYLEEK